MPGVNKAATGRRWLRSRKGVRTLLLVLSVLAVALLVGGFFDAGTLLLDGQRMTILVGRQETSGDKIAVRLDANGAALLRFDLQGVDPSKLPFFSFELSDPAAIRTLLFFARSRESTEPFTLGVAAGGDTAGAAPFFGGDVRWTSEVVELLVGVEGPANASVGIDSVSLSSAAPAAWLANLRWALPKPVPWTVRSINVATAQRSDLVFLSAASALSLLVLGMSPVLYLIAFTAGTRALPPLAGAFLISWLLIDAVWLRQQSFNMRTGLAAAVTQEKRPGLPADPIARLARFVERVDKKLPADPALRILVGSAQEFTGMRAAYHLYPRNVFWERGRELPAPDSLRRGDYLLIVRPSRHSVQDGRLRYPQWNQPGPQVTAELVDELGLLLKVR